MSRLLFSLLRWFDSLKAVESIDPARFNSPSPQAMRDLIKAARSAK